jgi:hypothetical protein
VEIINFSTGSFIREYLLRNIKLIGCYGVAKTSVLKKIGGMPSLGKSFSPYADSLVPILLSTHGSIAFIKSKLCFLRMHSGSISASASDFEAYTSAEADFLDKLSEVRSLLCSHIGYSEIIFNMVNWFRDDEMTVLLRDKSQSKYAVFVQFITHQIEVNYSRIDIKYWPIFTFRNILVIIKTLINKR